MDLPCTKIILKNIIFRYPTRKTKRKRKRNKKPGKKRKHELVTSLIENNVLQNKQLNEKKGQREKNINKFEGAISNVKEYESIIKPKKKGILNVAYRPGILLKRFKESNKFIEKFKNL